MLLMKIRTIATLALSTTVASCNFAENTNRTSF